MLEAYEAYGDYDTMAELTRALVLDAATAVGVDDGRRPRDGGGELDLDAPWRTVTVYGAVSEAVGEPVDARHRPIDDLRAARGDARRRAAAGLGRTARSCWSCTSSWSSTR